MIREKDAGNRLRSVVVLFVLMVLNSSGYVYGANSDYENEADDNKMLNNPAAIDLFTKTAFNRFSNFTSLFSADVLKNLGFCIKDVDSEWNAAFNFSKDTSFLSKCVTETKGDVTQRLCTANEIKFYLSSLYETGKSSNYLRPNKNCNLTTWVSGCEPGWACSVGKGKHVDLKNDKDMPIRSRDCSPCCEGFFCPHGITCMIPCPLGSYCPRAKLNNTSGVCDPYRYQLPRGQANHTCGGADQWADILSSRELFCSAGFYCPTTISKIRCNSGYYCRTGSTSPAGCFRLATCPPQTENQNITAYGILFCVALVLLLIIIYNYSDQVISSREKRQAESREAAARSARETAQARQRWTSAKDVARKGATGIQNSISRTFSRVKSSKIDHHKSSGQPKPGSDKSLPPMPGGKAQKKSQGNLTAMIRDIDEDLDNPEGFNVEIGDKNIKKQIPNSKELHTRSQIFNYAYGELEKEKAFQEQNKHLTFSAVITQAKEIEIRARHTIEVAFKDLTLTLKGKNKHLLRCVTGKIMPGKVSAVMGPSGAGKTTFLSALAGKATGCTATGTILINGKVDTMHSFKKIIGFVPQDDIVHGNLTVEENLWFSARCSNFATRMPLWKLRLNMQLVQYSMGDMACYRTLERTPQLIINFRGFLRFLFVLFIIKCPQGASRWRICELHGIFRIPSFKIL